MTTDKLKSVFRFYADWILREHGVMPCKDENNPTHLGHLGYMAEAAVGDLIPDGKIEKAMRWLGYIQGCMVCKNQFTLDEVKRHSMPEGEEFKP